MATFDREALVEHLQWKDLKTIPLDVARRVPIMMKEGEEKLEAGSYWQAHRLFKEAAETCFVQYVLFNSIVLSPDFDIISLYTQTMKRYIQVDMERDKHGDGELPRTAKMTRVEAEIKANQMIREGRHHLIDASVLRSTVAMSRGAFSEAREHIVKKYYTKKAELQEAAQAQKGLDVLLDINDNFANFLSPLASAIFGERDQIRRAVVKKIVENEGDPMAIADRELKTALLTRGFIRYSMSPLNAANLAREYAIKFAEKDDRKRAIRCAKRLLNIIQAAPSCFKPADVSKQLAVTDALIEALQHGPVAAIPASDNAANVPVTVNYVDQTITSVDELSQPNGPLQSNKLDAFKSSPLLDNDEPLDVMHPVVVIKSTFQAAPDVDAMERECPHCSGYICTEPKLIPGAGYKAGLAISGALIPFVVGLIPFAVIAALKPGHDLAHYCPDCNQDVKLEDQSAVLNP